MLSAVHKYRENPEIRARESKKNAERAKRNRDSINARRRELECVADVPFAHARPGPVKTLVTSDLRSCFRML